MSTATQPVGPHTAVDPQPAVGLEPAELAQAPAHVQQIERHVGRMAGPWAVRLRAYLALTKPRIVELLLVTTVPAMLAAAVRSGRGLTAGTLALVAVVVAGGALAAGAANALNCYLDRDIDEVMRRTAQRPLPAHSVSPRAALTFGLALAAVAVGLMAATTNWLATALTAGAIAYYDLVYTLWLKRRTPWNTFWGGACGAAPVLIGWAAVTGSLQWPAYLMFAIVFFWQMPHFYALAVRFRDDYARAGVPMLPVVASPRRVGVEAVIFAWLAVLASIALFPAAAGPIYLAVAVVAGAVFLAQAHRFAAGLRRGLPVRPMRLFHSSTTYLTAVFVTVAVDALLRT